MIRKLIQLFYDEEGANLMEYGLMLTLVAFACMFGLVFLRLRLMYLFYRVAHIVEVAGKASY